MPKSCFVSWRWMRQNQGFKNHWRVVKESVQDLDQYSSRQEENLISVNLQPSELKLMAP
jgi:hypothetical protein